MQADADQLTGKDVPLLRGEVRRLAAALDEMTHCRDNALSALYRDDVETDIDLEETIAAPFYGPGWNWDESDLKPVVREAADAVRPAFGKLTEERDRLRTELAAVHAFLDEQERAARLFELPTPAWVEAVRAASVPPGAPVSPVPASSVSESAQSPTGASA